MSVGVGVSECVKHKRDSHALLVMQARYKWQLDG